MTLEKAIRLARKWAAGHVCTLKEGEAQEYHQMCAEALEKSRWISVEERLPEHGQLVLVYCLNNIFLIVRWDNKTGVWRHNFAAFRKEFVAHWMPLPEPPTEEEV